MEFALSLYHVTKVFENHPNKHLPVLENINLEIHFGEFFIILGPSGSGKSTLLRVMSGLEKSFRGEVSYAPEISRRDVSFIFQQFAFFHGLVSMKMLRWDFS